MTSFQLVRDRDAWATIRGYVYQVDVTIDRWLDLQPGQELELERGEDIDVISQAIQAPDHSTRQRLLEQVKHRSSSIRLRSPEAVAALVNFFEHCAANPGASLRFRFVTNANIGHEQRSPLPDRLPALEAWERIRQGKGDEATRNTLLAGIRSILTTLRKDQKPDDIREETWDLFRAFVRDADDNQLTAFIRSFEWGMQYAGTETLRLTLQQRLQTMQYAHDPDHAYEVYVQLFFAVFERLTHSGRKRLTVEDREQLLVRPSFDTRAQALLETVDDLLSHLEPRVRVVEERLDAAEAVQMLHGGHISTLQDQVKQMARAQGLDVTIAYAEQFVPSLDVPPLVEHLSYRKETVLDLKRLVIAHTWTAVYGQSSGGKTQLIVLLVTTSGKPCLWVRLGHDRPCDEGRKRLDAACLEQLGTPPQGSLYRWYKQVIESLGNGGFLVLDGLPRLQGHDALSESLLSLLKACKATGVFMVSTSPYMLPERVRALCRKEVLLMMACPAFTHREAAELLQTYGAPAELLKKERVTPINRLARRHPRLLQAIGHYLQREHWHLNTKTYEALFTNQHATDVIEETLSSILDTVEEEASRQLLYRLNLILGSFSLGEVTALAEVTPVIERPRERFHTLMGLWVERDSRERYMISPLVRMVGSDDVAPQARKDCNRVLAQRLLAQGCVYVGEISIALLYMVNAEQYDHAGWFLILVLMDLREQDLSVSDGGVLSFWSEVPLPSQMDLGSRLYLRALQIATRRERELPIIYIVNDLAELMKQATANDIWAMIGVLLFAYDVLPDIHEVLLMVLRFLPQAHLPNGQRLKLPEDLHLEELIWLTVLNISTIAHLQTWMDTVSELTDQQRQYAFADVSAEQGSLFVANSLWTQEAEKPKSQQQWDNIQEVLETLSTTMASLKLELAWACAVRARIIVTAEYCNDLIGAVAIAGEALTQASDDPRVHLLIGESLGQQYLFAEEYTLAALWLGRACEKETEAFPFIQIPALLAASQAYGKYDPAAAVPYAQRAVALGKIVHAFPEIELVKVEGELALARWLAGDVAGSFDAWDSAGQRLLACRTEDDTWKGLYVLYGHISGYFTEMVTTGKPPDKARDGSPYTLPSLGIFSSDHQQRTPFYDRSLDCYLMVQLALFANAVGQEQRMLAWCQQGMHLARKSQQPLVWAMLCHLEIPSFILSGNLQSVLENALDFGAIMTAGMEQNAQVKVLLKSELIVDAILGEKPSDQWNQAEGLAAQVGMLPIVFWIVARMLTDRSEAETAAHHLAEHCRRISESASDKALWVEGAALIEHIIDSKALYREIVKQANRFSLKKHKTLRLVGYLGATVQHGMPLSEALLVHNFILHSLGYEIIPSTMYQQIILPFFITYWTTTFEQQRFHFTSPRFIEQELQKVQNVPEQGRAQALLNIIALGLTVAVMPTEQHD